MGFDDRWLTKTLTQISAHWYPWHTWLISMHCSKKMFHFLSASNGSILILSDIVITLGKSHKITFVGDFLKITNTCERCFWAVSETSRKRQSFLRFIWDVLKTSQKSHPFWDVSKRSQRCLCQWISDWGLSETSHAGWDLSSCFSLLLQPWSYSG